MINKIIRFFTSPPPAKFGVGEAVQVVGTAKYDRPFAIVVDRAYLYKGQQFPWFLATIPAIESSWYYQINGLKHLCFAEPALRPIPKEQSKGISAKKWLDDLIKQGGGVEA